MKHFFFFIDSFEHFWPAYIAPIILIITPQNGNLIHLTKSKS